MREYNCLIILIAAALLPAEATAGLAEEAAQCASLADDAQRLACYDRLFMPAVVDADDAADTGEATIERDVAPVEDPTPAAAASAATVADDTTDAEQAFGDDDLPSQRETKRPTEITATIVALEELRSGARLFVLDNNQVWREKRKTSGLRFAAGDEVRVKAGSLGSYRLFGSGKKSTSVQRVR